jgi:hypothetical protein
MVMNILKHLTEFLSVDGDKWLIAGCNPLRHQGFEMILVPWYLKKIHYMCEEKTTTTKNTYPSFCCLLLEHRLDILIKSLAHLNVLGDNRLGQLRSATC